MRIHLLLTINRLLIHLKNSIEGEMIIVKIILHLLRPKDIYVIYAARYVYLNLVITSLDV